MFLVSSNYNKKGCKSHLITSDGKVYQNGCLLPLDKYPPFKIAKDNVITCKYNHFKKCLKFKSAEFKIVINEIEQSKCKSSNDHFSLFLILNDQGDQISFEN